LGSILLQKIPLFFFFFFFFFFLLAKYPAPMRQVSVLPAGVQQWHRRVLASSPRLYAYASTLAVYILSRESGALVAVLAGAGSKTVTAVAWDPYDPRTVFVAAADDTVRAWRLPAAVAEDGGCGDGFGGGGGGGGGRTGWASIVEKNSITSSDSFLLPFTFSFFFFFFFFFFCLCTFSFQRRDFGRPGKRRRARRRHSVSDIHINNFNLCFHRIDNKFFFEGAANELEAGNKP
jgi:hypothetical protein